jgi:hypothetical protein
MVRLRRGERSVIVAIGLRRSAAERLAASITELVGDGDAPDAERLTSRG